MRLSAVAAQLQTDQNVTFRPSGHSMTGIIDHQQQVTVSLVTDPASLKVGDVVLVKIRGTWLLHRVKRAGREQLTIANARGRENGAAPRGRVVGVVTKIFPPT